MTKISCITTTFNDGKALLYSVNSILNQSFEDFQYIIVDDGSCAETRDIVTGLKDDRILVITQANDGPSGARNKALEQVRGDYVCFLDADDMRPNWAFRTITDLIDRDDPDLILCRGVLSEVRGDILPFYDSHLFRQIEELCGETSVDANDPLAQTIWPLAQLMEPQPANKVIRADLLRTSGARFPNTHFFEDVYFHTNILAAAQRISFLHTPCFAYFRRYQRAQTTSSSSDLRFDIIPVTKLTLESFARLPQFHDPHYRAAVVASCFKILQWCEVSISHHYRSHYRQAALAVLRLTNPLFTHFPPDTPDGLEAIRPAEHYIQGLTNA